MDRLIYAVASATTATATTAVATVTAVTAVTVQNTKGVKSIIPISSKEVRNQIIYSAKDIRPDAIKIGMLNSKSVIEEILVSLKKLKIKKIVLDPVMVSKGGTKLINRTAIEVLKKNLIRKVSLITPNIPEAEVLTKTKIKSLESMIHAANILLELGARNVLVKGGHISTKTMSDVFLSRKELKIFKNKKIKTKNTHGTGCTLSSAITTFLGCGKTLNKSCELAIKYVNQSIRSNLNYGKGHGPINHLSSIKIDRKFK